jgi:PPOX class probable F420-dependent enzyme
VPKIAAADSVDRDQLNEFLRHRHHGLLVTTRQNGRPQLSPVTCGLDDAGRVVIATYPQRAKCANLRRNPQASMCILSGDWDGPYVQVDGTAEVIDLPASVEPLVDYYRSVAGEHPDWDGYRAAMKNQGKSLIRLTIDHWGPVATGGFPPELAESLG